MADSKYKRKYYRRETTKDDLIEYLAHTEGLTKHRAGVILGRIVEYLVIHLGSLDKIKISGLGSLMPNYVKARRTYIPKGKEKRWIRPKLKISLALEPPIRKILDDQADRFRKLFNIEDPYMESLERGEAEEQCIEEDYTNYDD